MDITGIWEGTLDGTNWGPPPRQTLRSAIGAIRRVRGRSSDIGLSEPVNLSDPTGGTIFISARRMRSLYQLQGDMTLPYLDEHDLRQRATNPRRRRISFAPFRAPFALSAPRAL